MHKYLLALVTLTHVSTAVTIPFPEFQEGNLNYIAPFFDISTPSCRNPSSEFAEVTEEAENFAVRSLVTTCLSLKNPAAIAFAIRQIFPTLTRFSLSYEVLDILLTNTQTARTQPQQGPHSKRHPQRQADNQQQGSGYDLEDEGTFGDRDRPAFTQKASRRRGVQKQLVLPPSQEVMDHANSLMRMGLDDYAVPAESTAAAFDSSSLSSLKSRVLRLYSELAKKPSKALVDSQKTSSAAAKSSPDEFITLDDFVEPQQSSGARATNSTPTKDYINLNTFEHRQLGIEPKSEAIKMLTIAWKKQCERLEAHLKENIIGQNRALEDFVWGIYNHYSRLIKETFADNMDYIGAPHLAALVRDKHMPSTILIVGPSGTGKTEMFRLAMDFLGLPSGTGSGALMTRAGYIGDKPEYIVEQLFDKAKSQTNAETNGVVFIDEVDKMAGAKDSRGGEFTEGAQHTLLTLIEGSQPIKITVKEEGEEITYHVNTKGMLFVLAGAFADLIPHQSSQQSTPFAITDSALVDYGMRPELINRIHRIIQTHPLSANDFYKILMFKNSPLKQVMREYSEYKGVTVRFARDALDAFTALSVKQGLGARNLKRQIQGMVDALYLRNPQEIRCAMKVICEQEMERQVFSYALREKRAEPIEAAMESFLTEREAIRSSFLEERAAALEALQQKMTEAHSKTLTITKGAMEAYLRGMAPRKEAPPSGYL